MLDAIGQWLGNSFLNEFMVQVGPAFPTCETLHFIGLSLLFGSLLLIDLRGLGFFQQLSLIQLHRLVPIAILGFVINLVTGILFIAFDPAAYLANSAFLFKMALIPIAGINALAFEFLVFRPLLAGKHHVGEGVLAKFTSGLSLLLWTGVLVGGRLIPFV